MNIGMNDTIGTVDSSPIRLAPPAPLEDHHEHAVGRADAQQVQQRRLQRHQDRAEHDHQQQERQQHHGADEQRQPVLRPGWLRSPKVAVWPPTWAVAGLLVEHRREAPRCAAARRSRGWRRPAATSSGGRRCVATPAVAVDRGGVATDAMPGSAATAAASGSHARIASRRDVDRDHQRAVGAGRRTRRRRGRRPAARCATRARSPRRGSRGAARGPARRARGAAPSRRRRTPRVAGDVRAPAGPPSTRRRPGACRARSRRAGAG